MKNERADRILELIAELQDSKIVLVSYHANDPGPGMANTKELSKFKLFLNDTGLFTTLMFKDKDFTENIIYEKLLRDKLSATLGYLYENIVAQILAAKGDELFYHTFMNPSTRRNYEIDFLLARKNKICPLEVKSSGYRTHASLDAFSKKFSHQTLKKYLVYTKDFAKDKDIIYLPVKPSPVKNTPWNHKTLLRQLLHYTDKLLQSDAPPAVQGVSVWLQTSASPLKFLLRHCAGKL